MMKTMLICAPVTSRSGYGDHARDLFHSFYNLNKFNIQIIDVRWGQCPRNALDPNNPKDKLIWNSILPDPKVDQQPDVYVDVRIPNEFQQFGKYNIGITAGIETDLISADWINGCNKMDLIIVPSEHSKKGIVETVYDKVQSAADGKQQTVGSLKMEKPVEVLFEGADIDLYKKIAVADINDKIYDMINLIVKEDFAFLSVGLWGQGGYGEDRKNIGKMIKVFCEAFANKKKKPALILKTNGAGFSILDKEAIIQRIRDIKSMFPTNSDLPNIYLLHGSLTGEEMNSLYNHPKIKAMVSFTHGEGFGRPLLEASVVGLPIIASGWSGQLDFLNSKQSLLLSGELKQVPKSQIWENIIISESKWFNVNEDKAYDSFISMMNDNFQYKGKAANLSRTNIAKFSFDSMTNCLNTIIENHLPKTQYTELKLPKLKTVSKPKINLPKLKKV